MQHATDESSDLPQEQVDREVTKLLLFIISVALIFGGILYLIVKDFDRIDMFGIGRFLFMLIFSLYVFYYIFSLSKMDKIMK